MAMSLSEIACPLVLTNSTTNLRDGPAISPGSSATPLIGDTVGTRMTSAGVTGCVSFNPVLTSSCELSFASGTSAGFGAGIGAAAAEGAALGAADGDAEGPAEAAGLEGAD